MVDDKTAGVEDVAAAEQKASTPLLPDPQLLWQVFRRHLWLFIIVVLAVLAIVVAYLVTAPRIYSSSASVLIDPSSEPVKTTEPGAAEKVANTDQIDTEIRLIESPAVSQIAARIYAEQNPNPDSEPYSEADLASLADDINSSTYVARSGQSRVVDIVAQGTEPQFAADAANALAEAYLQSQVVVKSQDSNVSESFINDRLKELESNALSAQAALDNYRASHGLLSANGGTNAEQEVSNINQQLSVARAELAEAQGRYGAAREQLNRGSGGADVGAALGSNTISSMRQQESRVSAELARLRERYGPRHPDRIQAEEELRDIRAGIQSEITRVLSNLEAEVQTARSRVASLEASRAGAVNTLTLTGRAQTQLNELEQKAEVAQEIYRNFLSRSEETQALRDSAQPDARISAFADVPSSPDSPNVPLTVILGSFLALVAGLGTVAGAEYFRSGIYSRRDVERQIGLRYAGAVPTLKSVVKRRKIYETPEDYIVRHPMSMFTESFRSLWTFLTLSASSQRAVRVVAITSALPREGKTTTSVCLARSSALEHLRTIIVDADLRRRGTSEALGFDNEHDIYDYLTGSAPLEECVKMDTETGLFVLGTKPGSQPPRGAVSEENVKKLLERLKGAFQVVIIDTAPVLGIADSLVWSTAADRVLLLSQWKKTPVRAVDAAASMLVEARAKLAGLAMTQVDINKYGTTAGSDVYGYAKKFRGYYSED